MMWQVIDVSEDHTVYIFRVHHKVEDFDLNLYRRGNFKLLISKILILKACHNGFVPFCEVLYLKTVLTG